MKIINQSHKIIRIDPDILEQVELASRNCYKSEDKICPGSAEKMVRMLIKKGHTAMLEFGDITVRFITNRGNTHEMVRHRVGLSYAQESTRYVRHDGNMEFIRPVWCSDNVLGSWDNLDFANNVIREDFIWLSSMFYSAGEYRELLSGGWRPEQAREVLPNSLKTEIIVKGNLRAWMHMFKLRTSPAAHPQFRALLKPLLAELKQRVPVVFDDI